MQAVMNSIVQFFNAALSFFYDLYLECFYSVYCPPFMARLLYYLSTLFADIANDFSSLFSQMLTLFNQILSWDTIKSYILGWLPNIDDVVWWFANWWANVTSVITNWWSSTQYTVQSWIAIATEGLDALKIAWNDFWTITFPEWTAKLDLVRADLTHFFTYILPELFDLAYAEQWWKSKFLDVTGAINTAFIEHTPFWEGWQDWRDAVTEFFTNPFDWIKTHIFEPIINDFITGFNKGLKGE